VQRERGELNADREAEDVDQEIESRNSVFKRIDRARQKKGAVRESRFGGLVSAGVIELRISVLPQDPHSFSSPAKWRDMMVEWPSRSREEWGVAVTQCRSPFLIGEAPFILRLPDDVAVHFDSFFQTAVG
jgi:hypothetical protein